MPTRPAPICPATDESGRGFNADLTLSYRNIRIPSRHELTGELRYGVNTGNDDLTVLQDSLTSAGATFSPVTETSKEDNSRRDLSARLDFVRPLWSNAGKVEVGYKGTLRRLDASQDANRLARTGLLAPFSDDFRFDENVQAGYLTLGRTLGKFSAQGGLRAEQAWTTFDSGTLGQATGNDYFSLFPSAFLTFTPTIQNSFRVSYSRRIDRPDSRTLNPVASIDDPYSRRVGNPALKPAYTDAYELGYTRFSTMGSFSLSPFYRRTTDAFERVTTADKVNPQVTNITFANLATNESMGADANAQVRFGKIGGLGVNASLYRYVASGSIAGESAGVDATTWNTRVNGQVTPREGTTLSGFLFYNPPRQTTQGRFGGFSRMDVSLRQQLVKDKASLTLRVGDPFNMMRFKGSSAGPGYSFEFERRPSSRQVGLTLQYTFGQTTQRQRQRQQQNPPQQEGSGNDPFGG